MHSTIINMYKKIKNKLLSFLDKKSFGARALVFYQNKVLLIEHTYTNGWYTIGGAVDKGETPRESMIRELKEEVNIDAKSLKLFHVYHNKIKNRDDYIVFYICTEFDEYHMQPNAEIKSKQWFDCDDLPHDISPATLRRIKEYRGELNVNDRW